MTFSDALRSYFFYLAHPFKTHRILSEGENEEGIKQLGIYESLGVSWIFIVISGMLRILMVNALIAMFLSVMDPASDLLTRFYDGDRFTGFYFLVLSTILDVIFFPLITLFVIQFWEFVIKSFANLAGVEGDIEAKTKAVVSVSLSSHILVIAPIIGDLAQKIANFTQMYAGLRERLGFSRSLSVCVLMTPVLIFMTLLSAMMILAAL